MSLLLLLGGVKKAAAVGPQPLSGVAPVDTPIVYRGPVQQIGIKEELEIERRIMELDDEEILSIISTFL